APPSAPSTPVLLPSTAGNPEDNVTASITPSFYGRTGTTATTVAIYSDSNNVNVQVGSGTASNYSNNTLGVSANNPALGVGPHAITAVATDQFGNTSPASGVLNIQVVKDISPVHVGANNGTANTGNPAATTLPETGVTAAAGGTIFVTIGMDPGTQSVGVSDNATGSGSDNCYSKDDDVTNGTGTTGVRTLVFSAPVTRALSNNTITICSGGTPPSCSGGTAANMAATFFYSNGIVSPSPKDLCHTATGSGITKNTTVLSSGTTATSWTSSTPATTSQADELLVGALGLDDHGGNLAPGNSFTNLATSQNGGGASHTFQVQPSYLVVKATGQYAATWTYNQDSSRRWAAAIVTYKIVFPTIFSIAMDPADITTSPSTTNKNSVNFNVTFSEAVFGVDDQDFALDSTNTTVSGASITSVTPNDNIHYTVAVNTGTGNGTIQLNYHEGDTDYHMDINNIPLGGSDYVANGVGTYSFTGPTYTVSKSVATSTTVSSSNISPTYGDSVTFTAKVHAVSGATAPSGSVTFTIDGTAGAPVI